MPKRRDPNRSPLFQIDMPHVRIEGGFHEGDTCEELRDPQNARAIIIGYGKNGLLFIVGLPLMLWQWASHAHVDLPLAIPESLALVAGSAGGMLCLWSIFTLMTFGKGLPMNAFPPTKFVQNGPYRLFAHPIYVGFSILVYAASAYWHYRSGFFLVAPVVTLGAVALAMGFENFDMRRRFPFLRYEPWVGLVESTKERPDHKDKMRFVLTMYLVALFFFMVAIGQTQGTLLPRAQFVLAFYTILVLVSLWFIETYTSLRAMGLPLVVLAGALVLDCGLMVFLVGCVAAFIAPFIFAPAHRFFARMANSWHAWRFGPVRVINHGFFAFGSALIGFVICDVLTEGQALAPILVISVVGLCVSGLWGQMLEGSGRLKRPFGYFGALLGGALAFFMMIVWDNAHIWEIYGALFACFRCSLVVHVESACTFGLDRGYVLNFEWDRPLSRRSNEGRSANKTVAGLRIYQWLAISIVALGIGVTCLDAPFSPGGGNFGVVFAHSPVYLTIALSFTIAFGVDYPGSGKRFSEL